ncbi:putative quinate transport protein [Rosellinia necatrix]|uniref:Putative quinate transport protein n=1 Tax=Rosellinia necatrix TaxID=77044 RepID=A0A1S8AA38_ROSNE|nr:putative quinate transport protein [Rosellinia necatrix]
MAQLSPEDNDPIGGADKAHVDHAEELRRGESSEIEYGKGGLSSLVESPYVLGAAALASCGGFSFGYDQGVISVILTMRQFFNRYPETRPGYPSREFNIGFMTGILELGAFIGCLFLPYLADRFSRKWALTMATSIFTVGAIIQTTAPNFAALVVGRAIGGIGVGTLAMGAPLYISEISPSNIRGSLLVLEYISIVVGAITSYWITYGTKDLPGDISFRLPFGLQIIPALAVGIGIHLFPYSPRWLALRKRNNEGLASLAKLRGLTPTDFRVQEEWVSILIEARLQEAVNASEHPNTGPLKLELLQWVDLFRPKYLKRTTVALAIPFFQQFSGINAFVYYAPTFFASLGQDQNNSLILAGIVNIAQFAAGVPALLFLDKVGRRKIAIGGGFAMAVPHIITAGIVGKFGANWTQHVAVGWFGVALTYIYVLAYAASYGPLTTVLPAEIFPTSKRAKGVGASTGMLWVSNFIIGVIVPVMLKRIGWGTYVFFAAFCVLAGVFSFFMVPETAGASLEVIGQLFGDNSAREEIELRYQIEIEVRQDPERNSP